MKNYRNKNIADGISPDIISPGSDKKSKRKKQNDKNRQTPKNIMICPPGNAGKGFATGIAGYICRAIVIWTAVLGLAVFVGSAFELITDTNVSGIILASLIITAMAALICRNKYCAVIGSLASLTVIAAYLAPFSNPLKLISDSVITVINSIMSALYNAGYLSYIRFTVNVSTDIPTDELKFTGMCIVMLITAAVFVPCLVHRTRIIPPAVLSVLILVPTFVFNISKGNWGVSLVIISFASIIVMASFDRLYSAHAKCRHDTDISVLNTNNDCPPLSARAEEYLKLHEKHGDTDRKTEKRKRKERIKENEYTVDEELSDYFSKPEKRRKNQSNTDFDRQELLQIKKELRLRRKYERRQKLASTAAGGFSGLFMLIVCFIVIFLPASAVSGSFNTIPAFDAKMEMARQYVTAVLKGDSPMLDELEYRANSDNFTPHSTDAKQLHFEKKQLFYIESQYAANIYMRNWIGVDYRDGSWYPASDEQFDNYRALFGTDDFPSENLSLSFINYMSPESLPSEDYDYVTKYSNMTRLGYISMLVNIRRITDDSSLVNAPSYFIPSYGLLEYGTLDKKDDLTFVNYFDGIYTGRKFKESGLKYAFVANIPSHRSDLRSEYLSELISQYNLLSEAVYIYNSYIPEENGYKSYVTLTVVDDDIPGMKRFVYNYKNGNDSSRRIYLHDSSDIVVKGVGSKTSYTIHGSDCSLTFTADYSGKVYDVRFDTSESVNNVFEQYLYSFTLEESEIFEEYLNDYYNYSTFVYDTYTQKADSEIIASLADEIKNNIYSGGEAADGAENHALDVTLAALKNSSVAETYVQRDRLVRGVIDYIIYNLECEYTITPDTSAASADLDGVENFLTVTKQGYCVQFASSAALILRELGIPVRYNEGYIACDFVSNTREDAVARYRAYVHDYEAHAWIEVWFDGIGWVQYETTPEYYNAMYGSPESGDDSSSSGSQGSILDQIDGENQTTPEDDSSPEEETTLSEEEESESNALAEQQERKAQTIRDTVIICVVLILLLSAVFVVSRLLSDTKKADYERNSRKELVLSDSFGKNTSEKDRREIALALSDSVYLMLSVYGLTPQPGEFKDDFAKRASIELADIFGYPEGYEPDETNQSGGKNPKKKKSQPYVRSTTDFSEIFDALSAEEFGSGMTLQQMKQIAEFDTKLRDAQKSRLKFTKRFKLRFIKHII